MEVCAVSRDVPDNDRWHLPAVALAPDVLASALERLADSLHMGLPSLRLDMVTVAVPRVVRGLV